MTESATNSGSTELPTNVDTVLADADKFLLILDDWARAGWIRWLDAEFAVFLHQQVPDASPMLLLAAVLTSHQNGHGHVCLDIEYCLSQPARALSLPPESSLHQPALTPQQLLANIGAEQWLLGLQHPDAVGGPVGSNNQPLVLDQSSGRPLLYLRRFWHYEQKLARSIQQRLESPPAVDNTELSQSIQEIFTRLSHGKPIDDSSTQQPADCDWQKIACALAVRNRFAIITGGPGTGKTTTVVRLLAVLQQLHRRSSTNPEHKLRIKLAAPTGKAAARLSVSISSQVQRFNLQDIPADVSTVHRLLGPIRHSRFFRHNAANPLATDIVVVDEASMVDVELMAQLMDALPAHARLILLGDKDQLASVEAGAILGSLCQRADKAYYQPETAEWITQVTGETVDQDFTSEHGTALDQAITMLRYSHRFGTVPGIGALAKDVNISADAHVINQHFDGRYPELQRLTLRSTLDSSFSRLITDKQNGYGYYLSLLHNQPATTAPPPEWDTWALTMLQAHTRFQLLAALRKGDFGVEELNRRIESVLAAADLLQMPAYPAGTQGQWYAGRPIMVTRNDYNLGLMNGDIGIVLPYPAVRNGQAQLIQRVAFASADPAQAVRWILPSRLQSIETVFAMTVHKSQGSEFNHTALILPHHDNPILTRELVYTGITRAAERFTLLDDGSNVLHNAVSSSVFRVSGLLPARG